MAEEQALESLVPKGTKSDVEEDGEEFKELKEELLLALRQDDDDLLKHVKKRVEENRELLVGLYQCSGQLLRVAAQYNRVEKVLDLLPDVDVNEVSSKGQTALHSAAESGNIEAVKTLLAREAKWNIQDDKGLMPIHSALRTRLPDLRVVRVLVEKLMEGGVVDLQVEAGPVGKRGSMQNPVDNAGNNPLHLVAINISADYEKCLDSVQELKRFDPCLRNRRGDTPLILAAKKENIPLLEAMLKIFYGHEKNIECHPTDKDGDTLLDIAAVSGFEEMVVLLLDYGADPRRGVLFKIVSESVRRPEMKDAMRRIYRLIIDSVDKWSDGQDKQEVVNVLNETFEMYGSKNVVEFAIEEGAVELLEEIVHTSDLYEFHSDGKYRFLVRHCLPSKEKVSLLERIVMNDKNNVGAEMLNIQPFRHVSVQYIWYSSLLYSIFFVFQFIYMVLFSCYCFPNACELSAHFKLEASSCNASQGGSPSSSDIIIRKNIGFVVWPLVALGFSVFLKLYQQRGFVFVSRLEIVAQLFCFSFGTFVIFWFIVLIRADSYHLYTSVTALLFIFGWLQTFYYLSNLGEFYIFTNLVKAIIFHDVLKLACILVFVLVGFSFAIHTLAQTEIPYTSRDLTETVYLTFASTMNLGDLFDDTVQDSDFEKAGGNQKLLRVVFIAYVVSTFIILLNILIAMMSDTYQSNNKNAKAIWRFDVLKVSLALMITKKDTAEDPILPDSVAGPIIRSLPEPEDVSDDT